MSESRDQQQEPSMEEILSSIRRIIADEEAEEGKPRQQPHDQDADVEDDDDVLDLTTRVEDDEDAGEPGTEDADSADDLELDPIRPQEPAEPAPALDTETAIPMAGPDPTDDAAEDLTFEVDPADPVAPSTEVAAADLSPDDVDVVAVDADREFPDPAMIDSSNPKEVEPAMTAQQAPDDGLLSDTTRHAATGAFARLSQAYKKTPPEEAVAEDSGRTIEQFVEDILRPVLAQWLEENLPRIVEQKVEEEIKKIARRAELL